MVVSSCEVPVAEPLPAGVVVGVGLQLPPGLVGGLGDELQVVEVGPGRGGLDQDLVGFAAGGPRGRCGRSSRRSPCAHEIVTAPVAVAASRSGCRPSRRIWRTAALASLRPRRVLAASQAAVVAYPSASWSSPASNRRRIAVGGRAEQGGDRPELLQGLAAGGAVEAGGGRGVQVRPEGAARRGARPRRSRNPPPGAARAHPAPSGVHIMNHPLRWVPRGLARAGGHRGCVCYVLLTRGCLPPLQTTRSIDGSQSEVS